jgi:replicative DNA helicase
LKEDKKPGNEVVVTAEYRLLNALIKQPQYRDDSRIYSDLFLHETAKSVLQAIEELAAENIEVTQASLLQRGNSLDYSVNTQLVQAVFDIDDQGASSLDDILKDLTNARIKSNLEKKARELLKLATSPGDLNTDECLQQMFDIDSIIKGGDSSSLMRDFAAWSDDYIADMEERASGKRYTYGDPLLDKVIYKGPYPGAMTMIAATTGQGKSTFALNLISSYINLEIPCMYVSLEMSDIDTYDRLLSMRRGIPMSDLYSYDSNAYSIIEEVKKEKESLKNNDQFFFVDHPHLTIPRLRALIKEFMQRSGASYAVIVVDLLTQLKELSNTRGNNSVASGIEEAMNELNALAKEMNVHIIGIVQIGRSADNLKLDSIDDIEACRPGLNDIKNSNAIAERSRVVLSAFRKKHYADKYLKGVPGADEIPDIMEVQVLKNSSGVTGDILKYTFQGEFFKVTPLLEDEESDAASILEGAF